MKKIVVRAGLVAVSVFTLGGGFVLQACGDDDVTASAPDASADGATVSPVEGGPGPGIDAGDGGSQDAGGDAGTIVQFTVPAGGGSVDVDGASTKLTLAFPATAGGKTITLQVAKSEDLGWAAGTFSDVIKLGPDGTRFADPVIVKTANKVPVVMSYPDTATTKGPPAPLLLNAAGDGFELRHFSWLVIPGKLCDSQGYNEAPADPLCASAGASTTRRTLACKGYSYCLHFQLACCVVPGSDAGAGCDLATSPANPITWSMDVTDSNGGQYPYCDVDAGPETAPACGGGTPIYSFLADGGCRVARDCSTTYYMDCANGTCSCSEGNGPAIDGGTFAQADTCDTAATMKRGFVQKCNYPTK